MRQLGAWLAQFVVVYCACIIHVRSTVQVQVQYRGSFPDMLTLSTGNINFLFPPRCAEKSSMI